jgi:hypothetical protein
MNGSNTIFKTLPKILASIFRIIELHGKSLQIFEFAGLICKIFRNKELGELNPRLARFCHPERSEESAFLRQAADPSLCSG